MNDLYSLLGTPLRASAAGTGRETETKVIETVDADRPGSGGLKTTLPVS